MKYCTKCGTSMNDEDKFCSACGAPTVITCLNQTQTYCGAEDNDESTACDQCNALFETKPLKLKCKKLKFILPSFFAVFILFGLILLIIFSSKSKTEPTLKYCEELVGTVTETILTDDNFVKTNIVDIIIAESSTPNVFNVKGEISIFIHDDQDVIDIVTWQSKDNVKLTESEIEYFVEKMIKTYGKPDNESEDYYMWNNKNINISLKTEDKEIYLMFVDND